MTHRSTLLAAVIVGAGVAGVSLRGQSPPAGSVSGACHVSPIVADLDRSARFYRDLLGLNLVRFSAAESVPSKTDASQLDLHGLPKAQVRSIGARMPGVPCGIELMQIDHVDRRTVRRRMQDPGSAMLILLVRDLDTIVTKLKAARVPVITTGGAPMVVGASKIPVVVVADPDGHPIEIAQLRPLPPTTALESSNVAGMRLRITVPDLERTATYYRQTLGISIKTGDFTNDRAVMAMMGLPPTGEFRVATAEFTGSAFVLEFIEFRKVGEIRTVTSRVQDPGSYRLELIVRDIDETLRALSTAGAHVVSSGQQPVRIMSGNDAWRLAVVEDLNNLFLVLQQQVAPASSRAR